MKKISLIILLYILAMQVSAQRDFKAEYEAFVNQSRKEYGNFRDKCNRDYAEFMRQAWESFSCRKPIARPKEKPAPPIPVIRELPPDIKTNPIPLDTVILAPKPIKEPQPVEPIEEIPQPEDEYFSFWFLGTNCKVRLSQCHKFTLNKIDEVTLANAWINCAKSSYDNVIYDCLELRKNLNLCDYAYLEMLHQLSISFIDSDPNAATLLMSYIYSQSGYKMRLATSYDKLFMLFSSKHIIYDQVYYSIDNDLFYPYRANVSSCRICQASFPQEQSLSLEINKHMILTPELTKNREIKSRDYPDVETIVAVNKNLIDFYSKYPASEIGNNFMSKWAMYANTPPSTQVKEMLYPSLRSSIKAKSPYESVSRLLNFVQTGFVYGYDSKIWGYDRAFFIDETLYYPYCDCEDRSILFSRLVRDLLGLKVILVYYPGHLATAVNFKEDIKGDYISLNGEKFVICDPTYIGASVGMTMPDLDNKSATVILLE